MNTILPEAPDGTSDQESTKAGEVHTPVRVLRRGTAEVVGEQRLTDGTALELTPSRISAPLEGALSALWLALVLLAAGLVIVRL